MRVGRCASTPDSAEPFVVGDKTHSLRAMRVSGATVLDSRNAGCSDFFLQTEQHQIIGQTAQTKWTVESQGSRRQPLLLYVATCSTCKLENDTVVRTEDSHLLQCYRAAAGKNEIALASRERSFEQQARARSYHQVVS